jgi:hypothetical protein
VGRSRGEQRDFYRRAGTKGEDGPRQVDEADRIKAEQRQLKEAANGSGSSVQLR